MALLIGMKKPKEVASKDEESGEDDAKSPSTPLDFSKAMLEAIASKNADALSEALSGFIEAKEEA